MRAGSWSNANALIADSSALERAQRGQFGLRGRRGLAQVVAELHGPAGCIGELLTRHSRVQRPRDQFARRWIGLEHSEVSDHPTHATAAEAEPLAVARPVPE